MSTKKLFLLIILSVVLTITICREIEIENFLPDKSVKTDGFFDFGTLRLKKIGKNNFSISGEFELFENCGDEKEMVLEVRKKIDNTVIIKKSGKFCQFLQKEKLIWPDVQKKSNFPKGDFCPFPLGKYWIKDYVFDEKKFKFVPPGEYIGRVTLNEDGAPRAALNVECKLAL